MTQIYKTGIDVGSTTVKLVVFDENFKLIFSRYERHFSDVKAATIKVFKDFIEEYGEHSKQFDQNLNKYSELKDHTRVFFCSFRIRI